MTTDWNEADHPRDNGRFTEKGQQDPGGHVLTGASPASVDLRISIACHEAGLPVMHEMLTIIRDRGTVPDDQLMRLDAGHIEGFYNGTIGPVMDRVEDDLLYTEDPPARRPHVDRAAVDAHLRIICEEAGLSSMEPVLGLVADRDAVSGHMFMQLDAADVTDLYEEHVAPGLDQLEQDIDDTFYRD